MEVYSIEIDIPTLIATQWETHLINLAKDQLLQCQKELVKGKAKLGVFNLNQSLVGSLGVRTNALKSLKKISMKEKKRGGKFVKQKLEEASALLVDSR
jgi:hypothetical protein